MRGRRLDIPEPNPSGLCQCGCGQPTPLATQGSVEKGWVGGKPVQFINGHYQQTRTGELNPRFNVGLSSFGGRTICVHRDGNGWTYYARALMEAHLGRELTTDEIVLQVVTRAEHLALHRVGHDRSQVMQRAWATRRAKERMAA